MLHVICTVPWPLELSVQDSSRLSEEVVKKSRHNAFQRDYNLLSIIPGLEIGNPDVCVMAAVINRFAPCHHVTK